MSVPFRLSLVPTLCIVVLGPTGIFLMLLGDSLLGPHLETLGWFLLLAFFLLGPLLVDPLYYWTRGRNHTYRFKQQRKFYSRTHQGYGKKLPQPLYVAKRHNGFRAQSAFTVPKERIVIGVFALPSGEGVVGYDPQYLKTHRTDIQGSDFDLELCDRTYAVANGVRKQVNVSSDVHILDSSAFMNSADMKELGLSNGDELTIEGYFGFGDDSLLPSSTAQLDDPEAEAEEAFKRIENAYEKWKHSQVSISPNDNKLLIGKKGRRSL